MDKKYQQYHWEEKVLSSEIETNLFAREFAKKLHTGNLVLFFGDLGAGKTTFVKGIVEGLGGDFTVVTSPTFGLVHEYKVPMGLVAHCDFYRLANSDGEQSLQGIGGVEFFYQDMIYLVEWPEKVQLIDFIKKKVVFLVEIQAIENSRKIRYTKIDPGT